MHSTMTKTTEQSLIAPNTTITITLPATQVQEVYAKTLRKAARKIKVAGFRKGNVPVKVAEEHISPEFLIQEALQEVIPEAYTKAVAESGKKPVTYPEFKPVSVEKDAEWIVEAQFGEAPVIELKDYKKLVAAAKKEAEAELKKQAKDEKDPKKGEKADEKSAEKTEKERENVVLQAIYHKLAQELKPQVQEMLVKEEVKAEVENLQHQLGHMKLTVEQFLAHRKITAEEFSSELAAQAVARIQLSFIIEAIIAQEKITASDADMTKALEKITDPEIKKQSSDPRYKEMLTQTIVRQKLAEHLLAVK